MQNTATLRIKDSSSVDRGEVTTCESTRSLLGGLHSLTLADMRLNYVVGLFVLMVAIFGRSSQGMRRKQIVRLAREAFRRVREEDAQYETRQNEGVDTLPEDFTKVTVALLEQTPERAAEVERPSRVINWISFLLSKADTSITLSDVLAHPRVSRHLTCPFEAPSTCPTTKYRSLDGVCNNLKHPLQGAAFTPFARALPPVYDSDAYANDLPRRKAKNGDLRSARRISRLVHQARAPSPTDKFSLFLMVWGQFLAHTITDRAFTSGYNSARVDCCNQTFPSPQSECFNIPTGDPFDPFYQLHNRSCMGFLRSLETTDVKCAIGRREQLNSATSYIDASAVYGVEEENAKSLRTFSGGKLATSMSDPEQLPHRCPAHPLAERQGFDFLHAGDPRVTDAPHLTGIHTIWVREHNRIVEELAQINTEWDDERLYQETRRIISAQIQHITYNEWLPAVVGPDIMTEYKLDLANFEPYDDSVDASTANAVATATMRFGHTLVPPTFRLLRKDYSQSSTPALQLGDLFFRPNIFLMHEQGLMRGVLTDPSENFDPFVNNELTNRLFEKEPGSGDDLVAFNIQRGRDHGLPSYQQWRKLFNLSENVFDIPLANQQRLERVYSHFEDWEVFPCGVSEAPVSGGLVGPLFANMLGQQFQKYRTGDRFWYETTEQPQAFTPAQLTAIRGVTFAKVLCNTLVLDTIQEDVMDIPDDTDNPRVACSSLQQFDTSPWLDP